MFKAHYVSAIYIEKKDVQQVPQGFEVLGSLAAGLSYTHFVTTLNFTQIRGSVTNAIDTIDANVNATVIDLEKGGHHDTAKTHRRWWTVEREHALRSVTRIDDLQLRLQLGHHREERQILSAVAFLAGAASLGLQLFNQAKIDDIAGRVTDLEDNFIHYVEQEQAALQTLEKNQNKIAAVVNDIRYQLNNYRRFIMISEIQRRIYHILEEVREKVAFVADVVHYLLQGRLHPEVFQPKVLRKELLKVTEKLSKTEHVFLHDVLRDFYKFDVSHSHRGEQVTIVVHIPITVGGTLNLYRLLPSPFFMKDDLIFNMHPSKNILAVNDKQTKSIELSPGELAGCRRSQRLYYCDNLRIANKDIISTCIGAAFAGNIEGMKEKCEVTVAPTGEAVLAVNQTTFRILTKDDNVRVENTCEKEGKLVSSGALLTLKPGCTGFTHQHWFSATSDDLTPTEIVHSPMAFNDKLLRFDIVTLPEVKRQLIQLNKLGTKMMLDDVKNRVLRSRTTSNQNTFGTVVAFVAVLGVVTVIAVTAHIYWIGWRNLRHHEGPEEDKEPLTKKEPIITKKQRPRKAKNRSRSPDKLFGEAYAEEMDRMMSEEGSEPEPVPETPTSKKSPVPGGATAARGSK